MTNLAKFTQIRPVTSAALPEMAARHVRIIDGETGVTFADSRSLNFAERQKQARAHLAGSQFALRAAAMTRFLNGEVSEIETVGPELLTAPDVTVCRAASVLVWINSAASIAAEKLAGTNIAAAGRGNLVFPAIWRVDLLALLILPGLYPDYRRFLAMLLRLCVVVAREPEGTAGAIDLAKQLVDGRPSAGSVLAQVLAARLLFPSWIVAEPMVVSPLPTTSDGQGSASVLDAVTMGVEAVQLWANLSPAMIQPAVLDPAQLPTLSGMNAALASNRATPSEPRLVPIMTNDRDDKAINRTKGGSKDA